MQQIQHQWEGLVQKYANNIHINHKLWTEISKHYTAPKRHYHNLNHIADLLEQAAQYREEIEDYDLLCFSIWYHDIVYKATRKDNELRSAELAIARLKTLGISKARMDRCYHQILLTKNHQAATAKKDEQLLLDFDLAGLGRDWEDYAVYKDNVRKEYSIFPDFLYKKGRKKALLHFLERTNIYHTAHYQNSFEEKARENLRREIGGL